MILPIHLLDTGDEYEFGRENVLLSRLGRLGFPIAKGFVVSPPHLEIKNYLVVQQINTLTDFETKRGSLESFIKDKKPEIHTLANDEVAHFETHWPNLVKRWVGEIHSHYTRFSKLEPKHFQLKAHPVVFMDAVHASGIARWDPISKTGHIKMYSGILDPEQTVLLEKFLKEADHKLGISFDYSFIFDKQQIVFTRLSEIVHEAPKPVLEQVEEQIKQSKTRRSIKLYTTFSGDYVLDQVVDGYFLHSEQFSSHDQKLLVLLETMLAKHPHDILYQVSKRFYKSDAAAIKYCRNQKKYDNLNLVFSADQSTEELLELKRDLAVEGVNRKGKMKYWLLASTPAALIRIEENLNEGFDGVIIDLNTHVALLHAKHITEIEPEKDSISLIRFLEPFVSQLNNLKMPLIFSGNLVAQEKMIEKIIKWGVSGVITNEETEKMDKVLIYQEQVIQFGLGKS